MRLFVADTIPPYLLRMRRNIFLFYSRPRSLKPLVAITESSLSPELNHPISLPKLFPVRFRQRRVFLRFREGNISYTRRLIVSRFVDSCPRYRRTFTPICQLVIQMLANQTGFTKKVANVVTFLLLTFSSQSSGSFFLYSNIRWPHRGGVDNVFRKKVKTYSLPPLTSGNIFCCPWITESDKFHRNCAIEWKTKFSFYRPSGWKYEVHVLAVIFESEKWDAWYTSKGAGGEGRLCEPKNMSPPPFFSPPPGLPCLRLPRSSFRVITDEALNAKEEVSCTRDEIKDSG